MNRSPLRIVLFSEINSPFGYNFLMELTRHQTLQVVGVVTQPDTKLCDYYQAEPAPVNIKAAARSHGIPVLQPGDVNQAARRLALFEADFFIIANYHQILSRRIFELPKRFTLNFHPSLLPEYAGLWPFFWMARHHETQSGVSAIAVNEIIDEGDIVEQIRIKLRGDESEDELRTIHFKESLTLLKNVIGRLHTLRREEFQKQDLSKRSYYGRKDYALAVGFERKPVAIRIGGDRRRNDPPVEPLEQFAEIISQGAQRGKRGYERNR
jgi:methionyl-tRNA formyltransferase